MTPGLGRDPFDELVPPAAPATPAAQAPAPTTAAARETSATARRTFELPVDLIERLRDATWALSGPPHQLTLNRLAADALRRELDRLQEQHNDGRPFPPRGGRLRPGRRVAP